MGKIFRRTAAALLIVASVMTAALVGAAVQIFDGRGECEMGDFAPIKTARDRAKQRAQLDAQKKAGVYLKTFSRSVNSELTDDEVSAVTTNIIELVGAVQYENKTFQLTDQTTAVVVVATLKAKIDPEGIYAFIKRDEKEKFTIVQQNTGLQDAIAKNDKEFEDLKEQYKRATSQAERDRIRKQLNDADRDFLANEKLEEGNKIDYDGGGGDYKRAINLYKEALALKPDYAEAHVSLARVYSFLGQHELALANCNKAIELEPVAKNYIYRARLGEESPELALADFNKAIELEPTAKNYIYRARFGEESPELALADFNKAIELEPSAKNYIYRANFHSSTYELALADYTKAIELEPSVESYIYRSESYKGHSKYELALNDLNKIIELEPSAKNYIRRAEFYKEVLKDNDLEFADYNKAIEIEPSADSYIKRAGFYREVLKDNDLALTDYNKAIEIEPKFSSYTARAFFYKELQNEELFIADLNKAIEIEPTLMNYSWRAWVYKRMKKYELALADCNKIIELAPTFSNYTRRANIYSELKNYDLALVDLNKAIEIEPNVLSYLNRARFYSNDLKNYELAIKDCNKAIKFLTTSQTGDNVAVNVNIYLGIAYRERGKAYQALGEEAKAQADFAKAKELGHNG